MRVVTMLMALFVAFPAFAAEKTEDVLRNWALTQCLARAYDAPALREDALKVAKAYEIQAQADAALYRGIEQLVVLYLEKPELASTPLQRCMALRDGEALRALIQEHGRLRIGSIVSQWPGIAG